MTPYTLHVRWASGREERIPVTEIGQTVRLGANEGRAPQSIPVYHQDGPTIAIVELWCDEIPTIIVKREAEPGEREPTKDELSAALLALMRALRAIQRGDSEAARAAIAEAESVIDGGALKEDPS